MTSLTTTTPTEPAIETTAEIANGNDAKATNTKKKKKGRGKRKNEDASFSGSYAKTAAPVSRRPRRSAARKAMTRLQDLGEVESNFSQPSMSHYVGYVEEGETVDMIMKKFQKLEEVKQQFREQQQQEGESVDMDGGASKTSGSNNNNGEELTTEQLEEIFQKTSNFTVQSAVKANEMDDLAAMSGLSAADMGWENAAELLKLHDEDEGQYFWAGGQDEDAFWDDIYDGKHKNKKRRKKIKIKKARAKRERKGRRDYSNRLPGELGFSGVTKIAFVSDARGRFVTAIKKTRWVDPNAIVYTKVPNLKVADRKYPEDPSVPRSWAKTILPYVPQSVFLKSKEELASTSKNSSSKNSKSPSSKRKRDEDVGPKLANDADESNNMNFHKVESIIDFDLETVLPSSPTFNNVPDTEDTEEKDTEEKDTEEKDGEKEDEKEDFTFIGITMDPPWKVDVKDTITAVVDDEENESNVKNRNGIPNLPHRNGSVVPEDLVNLKLTEKLMPTGIVFIWVKKQQIGRVVKALETHNLYYVENLCWLKEKPSNDFSYGGNPYFRDSHETLLIFRKGHITAGGRHAHEKLELRHQRTEDSVMLPIQHGPEHAARRTQTKPDDFLQMLVERMLPRGFLNKDGKKYKRGRFLELWASPWSQKKGWTTVVEEQDLKAHYESRGF